MQMTKATGLVCSLVGMGNVDLMVTITFSMTVNVNVNLNVLVTFHHYLTKVHRVMQRSTLKASGIELFTAPATLPGSRNFAGQQSAGSWAARG